MRLPTLLIAEQTVWVRLPTLLIAVSLFRTGCESEASYLANCRTDCLSEASYFADCRESGQNRLWEWGSLPCWLPCVCLGGDNNIALPAEPAEFTGPWTPGTSVGTDVWYGWLAGKKNHIFGKLYYPIHNTCISTQIYQSHWNSLTEISVRHVHSCTCIREHVQYQKLTTLESNE